MVDILKALMRELPNNYSYADLTTPTRRIVQIETLSRRMRRSLAGKGSDIQGSVLADLVSVFFAGHHPAIREDALALFVGLVRDLIPHSEKEIFPNGLPAEFKQPLSMMEDENGTTDDKL